MYKYLLIDIDGTLIDFKKSFDAAAAKTLEFGGVDPTDEATARLYELNDERWFGLDLHHIERQFIRENYHSLYHRYMEESIANSKKVFNLNKSVEELLTYFCKMFGECVIPEPYVIETFEELSKDMTLVVATNGLTMLQPLKLPKFSHFLTRTYVSEEVGHVKPEVEFFEHIMKDLNAKPSECLMIGDSLENDIAGANASGIDSCFYNPGRRVNDTGIRPTYEIHDYRELKSHLKF